MRNLRLLSLAIAACVVLGFVSVAFAGIPSAGNSTANLAAPGQKTLYVCPRGDGQTLGAVGAAINIHVADGSGTAIVNFPFEDIWLESVTFHAVRFCQGGSSADANTDGFGNTVMSASVQAGGGCTQGGMRIVVGGSALTSVPGNNLTIRVNSPDMTGDLLVNLADVNVFSAALQVYNFCADYFNDGLVNLADVGIFSAHIGHACQ